MTKQEILIGILCFIFMIFAVVWIDNRVGECMEKGGQYVRGVWGNYKCLKSDRIELGQVPMRNYTWENMN